MKVAALTASEQAAVAELGWGEPLNCSSIASKGRHRLLRLSWPDRTIALKVHAPERYSGEGAFERESAMHGFLARHCPTRVPALIAVAPSARCLALEWVNGRKATSAEITPPRLVAMAKFLGEMNTPEIHHAALDAGLPNAADSAPNRAGHAKVTAARLARLLACPDHGISGAMRTFVAQELKPAWEHCTHDLTPTEPGQDSPQILSPSDFGWHNTLITDDGSLRHLDFEHAGWDDPAKLAADFILQPEQLLAPDVAHEFLEPLGQQPGFPRDLQARTHAIIPLQLIKWTTIILNPFLHSADTAEAALAARLEKAQRYWQAGYRISN